MLKGIPSPKMVSSADLQLITNNMKVAVTRCTRDLRYAWASEQYAEWLHRPVETIIGNTIQDVLGNEAFLRLLPYFERVLSGETVEYEDNVGFSIIGERWISAIYTPTFDSQARVDGWVAVIRDITDQKLTEATLLEREKLLSEEAQALAKLNQCSLRLWQTTRLEEGLGEMLRAVIELLGADKGNVQILDPERSVLTIACQQGFEQDFLDYFREVSAMDDSACGRALRKYEQVIIEDIEHDSGFAPHRHVARAAGFRAVVSTPLIGRDGKVLGLLSAHFRSTHRPTDQELRRLELYQLHAADFIERCQQEQEVRRSKGRYRKLSRRLDAKIRARTAELEKKTAELSQKATLLDLANDAILVRDALGAISYWNEGAERLYGWTSAEVLGRSTSEFLDTQFPALLSEILESDRWEGELHQNKKDGSQIIVASRWTTLRDKDGKAFSWLEINTDITARKKAEEAARRLSGRILTLQDEERRRIAKELHDSLGQYLAALKMNLDGFPSLTPEQSAAVASESSQIVEKCLTETRTISHLLHPPLLDEAGFDTAARWYVEGFAQRSGITVNLDLPKEPMRLHPDMELALFRALQECLTNIHKHAGGSLVDIRMTQDAKHVSLEIADNGKGIPRDRLHCLLGGAARVGVGIAGLQERFRELGGSLEIRSNGKGTAVMVTIPASQSVIDSEKDSKSKQTVSAA
jgi:PAS domain S-box-containing protein